MPTALSRAGKKKAPAAAACIDEVTVSLPVDRFGSPISSVEQGAEALASLSHLTNPEDAPAVTMDSFVGDVHLPGSDDDAPDEAIVTGSTTNTENEETHGKEEEDKNTGSDGDMIGDLPDADSQNQVDSNTDDDSPTDLAVVATDKPSDEQAQVLDGSAASAGTVVQEEATDPVAAKKRAQNRRLVGMKASSIKQMKDTTVRAQAVIAANKVASVQQMTRYVTDGQAMNNPACETYLFNWDQIVQHPDKAKEGERGRSLAVWTLMLPEDVDQKVLGAELEQLGKDLQEVRVKKNGDYGKQKQSKRHLINVVYTAEEYLESVYGKKQKKNAGE